jgi:predicted FMN-binding regulatory protein PaiB
VTSVSVGIALPTTIEEYWVPVPAQIVRVVPAWRSYRVVKIRGQLLIVEPATRKVVYVIEG